MSSLEVVVGRSGRAEVLARYVEFVAARCRPNTDPTEEQYELWRQRLAEFRESGSISVPIRGDDSAAAS